MKLKQKSQLTEKSKRILAERKEGKSIDELASIYGISRSRVYQILKAYGDTLPKSYAQVVVDKGIDKKVNRE